MENEHTKPETIGATPYEALSGDQMDALNGFDADMLGNVAKVAKTQEPPNTTVLAAVHALAGASLRFANMGSSSVNRLQRDASVVTRFAEVQWQAGEALGGIAATAGQDS